ncbi:hypothetical protein [Cerasicoccus arenae]|uniref:Uncharacterized protein n=1 Tax=Cerasicoccus arenae TaxID=424488 RepID=A0A8J3GC41_9BACT|nr:hypothetical protein [Cerasicoccus arenae]MBK1857525.1 hypothetical protein [Cerasicoccus arenae]GHB95511.1 hypothetical protein GCM10007047_09140 [Cerasicoccus arenae]
MDLTPEQKQQVAAWVNDGESLAEIQRRINNEFSVPMTYMDVRFLVDDLELDLVDKTPKVDPADATKPAVDAEASIVDDAPEGGVSVELDAIMRPGAMVSGSVTFSDGESMGWQLDQAGRLGLIPGPTEGYRPSEADVMAFQAALEEELRKKGM